MMGSYYKKKYGSIKGYLFLKMQAGVMAAVLFSVMSIILHDLQWLTLQFIPFILITHAVLQYSEKFKEKTAAYALLFYGLFAAVLAAPFLFTAIAANLAVDPLSTARYLVYGFFVLIILLIAARLLSRQSFVKGKVMLAGKERAVVKLDFDLFAGIRAGEYAVDNHGAKKGDTVMVLVKKPFFGASKPLEVIK